MTEHILSLKTTREYAIPIALAQALVLRAYGLDIDDIDAIAHVPIHEEKKRSRGFDQAEEIANHLCVMLDRPHSDVLVKTQNIILHSIPGGVMARREKVKGLYGSSALLHGERILLVDDVATTGLDLAECAKVLRQAGADVVNGLVGGRAVFRIPTSTEEADDSLQ
jgi:predicted amidophosphoribosyltransferase